MSTKLKKRLVGASTILGGIYLLFKLLPTIIAISFNLLTLAMLLVGIVFLIYFCSRLIAKIK
ncbi:MAG: hypothetical protein AAFV95_00425 [Bacteroidota bacterium]